jgi:RNA polymerase sigma-70 factor (ECF subfamily)
MHDHDTLLMRRAKSGDSAAFAELVRQYQPALRRVAESRLGSTEAAEDVVQETFLAAYKSRHTYNEQFGFRTWLWTILFNQCRRYAGRQSQRGHVLSLDAQKMQCGTEPTGSADTGADPSALAGLLAQERRELLEKLLAQLSGVQADALRLRFFGSLKFQEIAEAMQCSLCTAKNRVRWGLLKLSELVQRERQDLPEADANDSLVESAPLDTPLPTRGQRQ